MTWSNNLGITDKNIATIVPFLTDQGRVQYADPASITPTSLVTNDQRRVGTEPPSADNDWKMAIKRNEYLLQRPYVRQRSLAPGIAPFSKPSSSGGTPKEGWPSESRPSNIIEETIEKSCCLGCAQAVEKPIGDSVLKLALLLCKCT